MRGLMAYLVSVDPERTANVHEDPHLVAGDPAIMAWWSTAVLAHEDALSIARDLDGPRKAFQVDVPGGHVWHASWSLNAAEGRLPDETWAAIAQDIADGMGFSGADGKAPCRWVAVHHGPSRAGNDHIHFVTSLVREDGTKANVWRDMPRAQALARELERKYGLQVLESRDRDRGSRGVSRPELERQARVGAAEPERVALARVVRGIAAQAGSEVEFVAGLHAGGLRPRPWHAKGDAGVVGGYSVQAAGSPIRLGGGKLAPDLTLPRLRQAHGWSDQAAAVPVWKHPATRPAPEPAVVPQLVPQKAEAWERQAADEVAGLRDWLNTVPVTDRAAWAAAAHDTAGVFAGWSTAVEGGRPGPLAAAADTLARSAEVRAHVAGPRPSGMPSTRSAARLVASAARGGRGSVAEAALLLQLRNTAKAIHDAHVAAGDLQRARQIAGVMRGPLADYARPAPAAGSTAVLDRPRTAVRGPEREKGRGR
jgi:hypothetical protein